VSENFCKLPTYLNLNNISKILERLFLKRLQPYVYIASSPSSIIYNQRIANITLLIYLSLTSLILSIMQQLIMGLQIFSLSLDLNAACIRHNSPHHSSQSSHFQFRRRSFSHNWLKSHLSNRYFSFSSGSSYSFVLPSSCGVPQGSVLGPILSHSRLTYIASIVSSHGFNQQKYADDTLLPFPCIFI